MSVAESEKLATPDRNDSLANDGISSTDLKIIINGGYFCGIAGIRELLNVIKCLYFLHFYLQNF
jgi:hypothetical protein